NLILVAIPGKKRPCVVLLPSREVNDRKKQEEDKVELKFNEINEVNENKNGNNIGNLEKKEWKRKNIKVLYSSYSITLINIDIELASMSIDCVYYIPFVWSYWSQFEIVSTRKKFIRKNCTEICKKYRYRLFSVRRIPNENLHT
ncbi:hypothetical protein RFI_26439, partial [Reticulomyxa filosa]